MSSVRNATGCVVPALLALACAGWGCAFGEVYWDDPMKHRYSLELMQDDYSKLVRWAEFGKASAFVAKDEREAYVRNAPAREQLRFTEFESGPIDFDDDAQTARVTVTYQAYLPASLVQISVREIQHWSREGRGNNWQVRPEFVDLDRLALQSAGH